MPRLALPRFAVKVLILLLLLLHFADLILLHSRQRSRRSSVNSPQPHSLHRECEHTLVMAQPQEKKKM